MKEEIEPSMPLHRFVSKLLSRLCGVADSADPRERRAFFSLAVLKRRGVTHIETRLQAPDNFCELVTDTYACADGVMDSAHAEAMRDAEVMRNIVNVWNYRVAEPSPVMDYEQIAKRLAFSLKGYYVTWFNDLNGYVLVHEGTGQAVCFLDREKAAVTFNPYQSYTWHMTFNDEVLSALATAACRLETLRKEGHVR